MDRPILVTGAAGFAGSHLVDQLLTENVPVVAWDRSGATTWGSDALRIPGGRELSWVTIELLDRQAVAAAIAELRPQAIYHCAGAAHVPTAQRDATTALQVNALGTHHVIDAVRRAHLDARVVVVGSALVYRSSSHALSEEHPIGPSDPYGLSKLAQELIALESAREGLDVVLVRPFNHIGPRQQPSFATSSFARQIALAEVGRLAPVLKVGNLDARRDVTDVRDTVRAYRLLGQRGQAGRPYNVCSGYAPSVGDLLDRLRKLARVVIDVEVDPGLLRPSDIPILVGDARRIREEVGWVPEIPLDRTLRDLLDHWRSIVAAG